MSLPATINVSFDFSNGPIYGIGFTMGDPKNGILGTNVFSDSASDVVDLSSVAGRISIRRGRNIYADQFEAGSATVRVYDANGDWNPENVSSPYYGKLQPLRKLRISATYNGTVYYLFSGYTTKYNYSYPKGQEIGYVDISAEDAFRIFNMAAISTVTGASAGQTTGTRIGKILDTVSWPTSMREIETGDTTCQADPATNRSVLDALKRVEGTEYGAFYINPEGDAVFKSRSTVTEAIGATPTVFNQDGTGINYANLKFAFDDRLIINQVAAQRVGGVEQTAISLSSIDQYFIHSVRLQDLLNQTDDEVMQLARAYVASHKETSIRIDEMTLDLTTPDYSAGVEAGLSLDYFDVVEISNNQQGGSTLTKTLEIMGIAHDITPNTWQVRFSTQEPIIDGFILGSTVSGIIGTNVLAYQEHNGNRISSSKRRYIQRHYV